MRTKIPPIIVAIVVKFADRLSNLVRMVDWPGDWQEDYLKQSCFWPTEAENQRHE
jgi:hypothetical protein